MATASASESQDQRELLRIVGQNVESIAKLRLRRLRTAKPGERRLSRLASQLGRPAAVYAVVAFAVAWLGLDLALKWGGHRPFDPAPFGGLQTLFAFLSVVTTLVILLGQNRAARLNEHRAELNMQLQLLIEQRTAQLVAQFEALRRDLKDVEPQGDPRIRALSLPADPAAVVEAIEQALSKVDARVDFRGAFSQVGTMADAPP